MEFFYNFEVVSHKLSQVFSYNLENQEIRDEITYIVTCD